MECKQLLINSIKEQMRVDSTEYEFENRKSVILVIGVNGVGKTTSVGKLAGKLKVRVRRLFLLQQILFVQQRENSLHSGQIVQVWI